MWRTACVRAAAVLAGALAVAPTPAGALVTRGPGASAPSAPRPCPTSGAAGRGPWSAPRTVGQGPAVTTGADGVTAVTW